ncbi:MAG: hypothetical protein Q9180_003664 [Flavoplaca navasiana]
MASNHQITDARPSSSGTESDEAANAPEVDRTVLAPEWRGDNIAPEVTPECAMQVFFDNSPPEATDVEPPDEINNSLSSIAPNYRKARRTRIILALVATITILTALGIGLGLGLSHRKRPEPNVAANSTITNQVAAKPFHSMADDTAIAAVTLSNGNRQVFFQEESGYIRRALYSAEAGIWQTSINSNPRSADLTTSILFAKKSTPLAAAVMREDSSGIETVSLFYVGRHDNHLSCLDWQPNGEHSLCLIDLRQSLLAADSRQISATWITNNGNSQCVLLIYPDPSQKLNILRLSLNQTDYSHKEFNETAKFNSLLNKTMRLEPGSSDAYLSETCTAVSYRNADEFGEQFYMNCFANHHSGEAPSEMDGHDSETPTQKSSVVEFTFHVDISHGNITIDSCMPTCL